MKAKFDPQADDAKGIGFCSQFQLRMARRGAKVRSYRQKQVIFSQEDPAGALFYVRQGRIKLTIFSSEGKAATIAILDSGDFLGEECLVPCHSVRLASAVAITDCSLLQVEKEKMLAALDSDRALARSFTKYLLTRKARAEERLADQLSHSSESALSGCFFCWAVQERAAKQNATLAKSPKRSWPKWWEPRARASATS